MDFDTDYDIVQYIVRYRAVGIINNNNCNVAPSTNRFRKSGIGKTSQNVPREKHGRRRRRFVGRTSRD